MARLPLTIQLWADLSKSSQTCATSRRVGEEDSRIRFDSASPSLQVPATLSPLFADFASRFGFAEADFSSSGERHSDSSSFEKSDPEDGYSSEASSSGCPSLSTTRSSSSASSSIFTAERDSADNWAIPDLIKDVLALEGGMEYIGTREEEKESLALSLKWPGLASMPSTESTAARNKSISLPPSDAFATAAALKSRPPTPRKRPNVSISNPSLIMSSWDITTTTDSFRSRTPPTPISIPSTPKFPSPSESNSGPMTPQPISPPLSPEPPSPTFRNSVDSFVSRLWQSSPTGFTSPFKALAARHDEEDDDDDEMWGCIGEDQGLGFGYVQEEQDDLEIISDGYAAPLPLPSLASISPTCNPAPHSTEEDSEEGAEHSAFDEFEDVLTELDQLLRDDPHLGGTRGRFRATAYDKRRQRLSVVLEDDEYERESRRSSGSSRYSTQEEEREGEEVASFSVWCAKWSEENRQMLSQREFKRRGRHIFVEQS